MRLSRRKLLAGAAGLAGVAAGAVGFYEVFDLLPRLRRAASPRLPEAVPGPLDPELRSTLLAAVATLVISSTGPAEGTEPLAPYRHMLESRSEGLPGYRELYRRFERAADREAAATGAPSFAQASETVRREVLATLCPAGRIARLRAGLTDPDRARFRLYLAREILDLYAATDAWVVLGYEAAPGTPRGLAAYTRPPAGADPGNGR